MITDLGRRYIDRARKGLVAFESGKISLHQLIADLEALFGLLLDEADPDWVGALEAECNRLELVNTAAIEEKRKHLEEIELREVAAAIEQIRCLVAPY